MMTQNNEILERIMGTPSAGTVDSSPSFSVPSSFSLDDELVPQMRVVTVRYKVYVAIIVVLLAFLFMEWLPRMQATFNATHMVYEQTQAQLQQLTTDKLAAERSNVYLEEIEAKQTTLETCLNEEDATACASLPTTWNITYKGKTIKDFSVPLAYLQLNSLYNPKMPVDEKKVLRNLNEYLIRDGVHTGASLKNGDIESISIGDPSPVKHSAVFFSVPLKLSIKFEQVKDLISFVRNVEKKLIVNAQDRILYKVQEVWYDIVASDKPQTTDISMIAYYYHDTRFQDSISSTGQDVLVWPETSEQGTSEKVVLQLGNCGDFPNYLETCTSYSCEFTDTLTQELKKRDIIGMVNGKCKYLETSSNDGKMVCNYTEPQRKRAAEYYATSFQYLKNGEEITAVDAPLSEFIDDGVCVVSWYSL